MAKKNKLLLTKKDIKKMEKKILQSYKPKLDKLSELFFDDTLIYGQCVIKQIYDEKLMEIVFYRLNQFNGEWEIV